MPPSRSWPFDDEDSARRFGELLQKLMDSSDGGVAFFGAGASAPAGLPAWTELYRRFLEHFDSEPATPSGDSVRQMRINFDHHADRDEAKALAFIRNELGASVAFPPPVVKLMLRTHSLRAFYTTNLDEVLFTAVAGEQVAVYPDYKPLDARSFYLHGRASIAKSFHHDLVLGKTGYDLAYRELPGTPAKTQLQRLARYPVVFVGFSMTDEQVMWTLEEMAEAVRRHQRSDDVLLSEEISPLDWYALLKAPPQVDPGRLALKSHKEKSSQAAGVEVIWYSDGGPADPHRALLEVVQQLHRESRTPTVAEQEPGVVEALFEAEMLAAVTSPTPSDVRKAEAVLIGHPRVAEAFMRRVDGLRWFHQLRDTRALDPKPSIRDANGMRSASYWFAVDFLRRIAPVAPAEVKDFLLTIETDNWVAIRQAFHVLEALDDPTAAALSSTLARWAVRALPDEPWLLTDVAGSARQLDSDGKDEAAFALVEATLLELASLTPGSLQATRTFGPDLVHVLAQSASGPETAAAALRLVLQQEYDGPAADETRYVRLTIEPHQTSPPDNSTLGLMIDLLRDTLQANENADERARVVELLLRSEWPTERRLGIAHCFLRPSDLPTHEMAVIREVLLSDPHVFHELAKLIVDHGNDLSDESIRVLKDFAAGLYGVTSQARRPDYALWARVMPDNWLPELSEPDPEDTDDPDRRLFRDLYISVVAVTAPLDQDGFAERAAGLTPEALLDLVRDPAAAGVRSTWHKDPKLMWDRLAEYAKEQDQLASLLRIRASDLGGDNSSWRAIEAMAEVAGDSPERWSRVLDWADGVVSETSDDAYWSLGLLLVKAGATVPLALSERVRGLALQVIARTRRVATDESGLVDQSMLGGFLNHPAGKATQPLFELLRRELVEYETANGVRVGLPAWFREIVLGSLSRDPMSLGIDAWIGLGRSFALLSERSWDSVAFVAQHLESESSYNHTSAIAFWSGYLWAPSVTSDALSRLRAAYRKYAHALQEDGVLAADLRSSFSQHIVIGALREISGFRDMLDDTLDDSFGAAARGAIASALGRGVAEASESPGSPFHSLATDLFRRYWTEHVNRIGGQDGAELARYLGWLDELELPPSEVASLIEASLAQAASGAGAREVFDYLKRYVEADPAGVLGLLNLCVEWWRVHGGFWLDREDVSAVLDRLAPRLSGDVAFREVVDGFAELGALPTETARRYLAGGTADTA